jgi:hypothetical protein
VFEAVGWRDEFFQREFAASLFRDRVSKMGVSVDECGEDDVVTANVGFFDGRDFSVIDDNASPNRVERVPPEDSSFQNHIPIEMPGLI